MVKYLKIELYPSFFDATIYGVDSGPLTTRVPIYEHGSSEEGVDRILEHIAGFGYMEGHETVAITFSSYKDDRGLYPTTLLKAFLVATGTPLTSFRIVPFEHDLESIIVVEAELKQNHLIVDRNKSWLKPMVYPFHTHNPDNLDSFSVAIGHVLSDNHPIMCLVVPAPLLPYFDAVADEHDGVKIISDDRLPSITLRTSSKQTRGMRTEDNVLFWTNLEKEGQI